jgi:hypothetical protein
MPLRRRFLLLTLDLVIAIVLLTFAAGEVHHAPTGALFFGLIGLMSLTSFVVRLQRIEGLNARLGLVFLSVFGVLGAVVLGDTIAGGNEGLWTVLGYAGAALLLLMPTLAALAYLRDRLSS